MSHCDKQTFQRKIVNFRNGKIQGLCQKSVDKVRYSYQNEPCTTKVRGKLQFGYALICSDIV